MVWLQENLILAASFRKKSITHQSSCGCLAAPLATLVA
jgi:hypothetical protein